MTDPLERIRARHDRLTGKSQGLANFISHHYRRVAFMSARELAEAADVSLPTVVRFVARLGFDGYQAFSRAVQERVNLELTGVERLETALRREGPQPLYMQVISREQQALKQFMATFSQETIDGIARRLATAAAVVIVGVRYVSPLAVYLAYTLRKLRPNVTSITSIDSVVYDDLALHPRDTVVVGIGFARYATELIEFLEFARKQRFDVVALTDHAVSAVANVADHVLTIPVPPMKFMSFFGTPTAAINVLILEVARRVGSKGTDRLELLEEVAKRRHTYSGGEGRNFRELHRDGLPAARRRRRR